VFKRTRKDVRARSASLLHRACDTVSVAEVRHEGYAVLADRIHRYKLPLGLLYAALTENRAAWLRLQPGEITPEVVEAIPLQRVIWSSFWPASPDDIIELDLSSSRQEHREPTRGQQVANHRRRLLRRDPLSTVESEIPEWRKGRGSIPGSRAEVGHRRRPQRLQQVFEHRSALASFRSIENSARR
jgi:hypothetical protein